MRSSDVKEIKVIYPGTFDPITFGHLDIIKRATYIFDEVIVGVVRNPYNKDVFFSYPERKELVERVVKEFKKVKVEGFDGLVIEFAQRRGIKVLLRGLRMISDFEYEFQMALMNRQLASGIETVFLMPHPNYSYISSRLVKEIALLGGDLREFLPKVCIDALKQKVKNAGKSG